MKKSKYILGVSLSTFISIFLVWGFVFATITLSNNIQLGSGTPNLPLNGDDLYVTGTFEVDGITRLEGDVRFNGFATTTASNGNIATQGTLTVTGIAAFLNATTTLNNISYGFPSSDGTSG